MSQLSLISRLVFIVRTVAPLIRILEFGAIAIVVLEKKGCDTQEKTNEIHTQNLLKPEKSRVSRVSKLRTNLESKLDMAKKIRQSTLAGYIHLRFSSCS